ncbi:DUF6603 domain-containing protein [Kitasatospora sp. NPDC048545]|uniref:DUF6603 domain-containing protein n=1 Tax=Kitasatospora sp. NPDC048545 TaxID=3157208 RepID=UPI0033F1D2BD
MALSVADLLDSFPTAGEDFVLPLDAIELPELYQLFAAGKELVLRVTEVAEDQLTVIGEAALDGHPVALRLVFLADAAEKFVAGLRAEFDAAMGLVELAAAWGLELAEAPAAFLAEVAALTARYDLTVGRVAITAQTERLRLVFARPARDAGLVGLVGVRGSQALLSQLPYVGPEIPDVEQVGVHGVELIVVGPGNLTTEHCALVNAAVAEVVAETADDEPWWPLLPERDLVAGLWVGAAYQLPQGDPQVWAVRLAVPDPEIDWVPDFPALPPLGRFTLSGFGLRWPLAGSVGSGLGVYLRLSVKLGWLDLSLPDVGFDFSLPDMGPFSVVPRLPKLALSLGGAELTFRVPEGPDLPAWPGLPGLPAVGLLTGWWDGSGDGKRLVDLLALFGFSLPSLPDLFNPQLPSLGLRFDLSAGDFELVGDFRLVGDSIRLRFVLAGLPSLSGPDWGKVALLGVTGFTAWLTDLPFIGSLLTGLSGFAPNGLSLAGLGSGLTRPQLDLLNAGIGSFPGGPGVWWPTVNWDFSGGGQGGSGWSLDMGWKLPGGSGASWGIPWPQSWPARPDLSWLELELPDLALGPLDVSRIGLSWPGPDETDWWNGSDWVLRLLLDARITFGAGITVGLPGLGFDIDLKNFTVHPRFPSLSLSLPGNVELTFAVPTAGPPWPVELVARWQAQEGEEGIPVTDLMIGLGSEIAEAVIPEQLMPTLRSAGLYFNFQTYLVVLTTTTDYFGWMLATRQVKDAKRRFLLAVRGTVRAKASDLPVIVEPTSPDRDITVGDIHFAWAGATGKPVEGWTLTEITQLIGILAELDIDPALGNHGVLPVLPKTDFDPGMMIWASLTLGVDRLLDLVWPADRELPARSSGVVLGRERAAGDSDQGAEKSLEGFAIGPVRFRHAGLGYAHGLLFIALDATLAVGPLTLDLLGLGLGVDKDWKVQPVLRGAALALEFPGPPRVEIAGAFARLDLGPEFPLAFAALGRIEIQDLIALQLAGSWARNEAGWDSVFGYAELVAGRKSITGLFSIGPVTVTGVVLGIGINSTVRIPTTSELESFPLTRRLGAQPPAPDGEVEKKSPVDALNELVVAPGWVTPAQGQYWLAGGMEFTVYKFIHARAMVLVEFGQAGWKAILAGNTTLSLPPTMPNESDARAGLPQGSNSLMRPIGQVIVDFVFAFDSALGRFSMDTVIAKGSFLLDPAATLTGGISLYVWGKDLPEQGISKGFVLSAGGYHPQFPVPRYYPKPPRIGWLWERGPITIKGQAYAALSDGAFMIGGSLAAVFEAGKGIQLRAWFTAHVDALVQWKPFYADLALGLSIGVSATVKVLFIRIRVSLEVGVSLQLWLPPIGGRAKVKVWFISFSFGFGADRKGAPPVPWEDFHVQLPAPSRTTLKRGIELPDATEDSSDARAAAPAEAPAPLLVRMDGFTVAVESAVPASKITLNDAPIAGSDAARIDIRPMRLTGVVSEQVVEIRKQGATGLYDWRLAGWKVTPTTDGVPRALWGRPLANPQQALGEEGLVPDCLTGLTIEVPGPERSQSPVGPVPAEALKVEPVLPDGNMPLHDTAAAGSSPEVHEHSVRVITNTLTQTATKRTKVHQALAALGVAPGSDGPLTRYADLAGNTLTDPPLLTTTGTR